MNVKMIKVKTIVLVYRKWPVLRKKESPEFYFGASNLY